MSARTRGYIPTRGPDKILDFLVYCVVLFLRCRKKLSRSPLMSKINIVTYYLISVMNIRLFPVNVAMEIVPFETFRYKRFERSRVNDLGLQQWSTIEQSSTIEQLSSCWYVEKNNKTQFDRKRRKSFLSGRTINYWFHILSVNCSAGENNVICWNAEFHSAEKYYETKRDVWC